MPTNFYYPYVQLNFLEMNQWGSDDDPEYGNDLDRFEWLKNNDDYKPDWDDWLHKPGWRHHEAAAIMTDIDPRYLTEDMRQTAANYGRSGAAGQYIGYEDFFVAR
jgi:hypothetical protein